MQTKPPGIRSRTARRWLSRLGYKWQDVKKGVFLDGHEREDVIEYRRKFLEEMKEMLPYLVEFAEDGTIQEKIYPAGCMINGHGRRPIVIITHDESIFSANDEKHHAWVKMAMLFCAQKAKERESWFPILSYLGHALIYSRYQ